MRLLRQVVGTQTIRTRAMNKTKSATALSKLSHINPTEHPNTIETFITQSSSLEKTLIDSLQPDIQNKLILTPTHYQTLLNEARCTMAMYAQHSDVLTKGAALLDQEQKLRNFFNMQRTLLIGV